jgi:hypothetical protein
MDVIALLLGILGTFALSARLRLMKTIVRNQNPTPLMVLECDDPDGRATAS